MTADYKVLEHMESRNPVCRLMPALQHDYARLDELGEEEEPALGGWVVYTSMELTQIMQWMCEGIPRKGQYQLVLRPEKLKAQGTVLFMEARQHQAVEQWEADAACALFETHEPPFGDFWIA